MNKKIIAIVLSVIVLLLILAFLGKTFILDKKVNAFSGLKVDSIPESEIYLNDKKIGKTPFEISKLDPGEYTLKLVVTDLPGEFAPWQIRIKLAPLSQTYVNRTIGKTESESGHQIIWLEKLSDPSKKELAVVSSPDNAKITVDGLEVGNTSKIITDLSEGDHRIIVSKEGYSSQEINASILKGFRLNVSVKFARADTRLNLEAKPASDSAKIATGSSQASRSAVGSEFPLPYVLIKETGLGFLRVRTGPSKSATESGRVNVGDKFPLLSEESGWSQIKTSSQSGWVSDQYVQKFR